MGNESRFNPLIYFENHIEIVLIWTQCVRLFLIHSEYKSKIKPDETGCVAYVFQSIEALMLDGIHTQVGWEEVNDRKQVCNTERMNKKKTNETKEREKEKKKSDIEEKLSITIIIIIMS